MTTSAPTGLDSAQRSTLERLVIRARVLLENDLVAQLEGRFGIHLDGTIEDEDSLPDDPTIKVIRRDLEQIVAHLRTLGEAPAGAVARLLREAAFTHLNRLVAIRIAEAIGLLPESLANGPQSRGFKDLGEIMPILAGDYRAYLRLCGDELAADAPALFDPRNPLLALEPTTAAFDELVALMTDPGTTEIWQASDTLGWAYQFFNSDDERREMREASAPRNSRELAVRNQFFTPRYVVDFLVQNTLGRRLLETEPDTPLVHAMPLLVDPPTEAGEALPLRDLRILDPACGSGHFLLACYDLLERAWQLKGVEPADAACLIVPALWGIDIDPRCAQIASAVIIFRARRYCHGRPLPHPNIITARTLPDDLADWEDIFASLPTERRDLVQQIREALAQAPVLGPLLKVEEHLAEQIRVHFTGSHLQGGTLVEGLAADAFGGVESEILDGLQQVADSASSTAAERLLVAEADDAIRFVDAMRQRYDVVLMNPPYGLPVEGTESYLKRAYPDSWTDMFACFTERAWELAKKGGYVGALVSSQLFQIKRLRGLRQRIIEDRNPVAVIHLGLGVLQGATVDTAAIILPTSTALQPTAYLTMAAIHPSIRELELSECTFQTVNVAIFSTIPGNPLSFEIPQPLLQMFSEGTQLEPNIADVRKGCATFDNFRFLRLPWEVGSSGRIRGWRPYIKGGEYQPYFADQHMLEDWREEGSIIRGYVEPRGGLPQLMQSSSYWERPGLTFPYQSSVGFGARLLPEGVVFAQESISIFPREGVEPLSLLGLLNSTPVAELFRVFGRGRKTENGWVKALPIDSEIVQSFDASDAVRDLIFTFREFEAASETSAFFAAPLGLNTSGALDRKARVTEWHRRASDAQEKVDEGARKAWHITGRFVADVEDRSELVLRALPDLSAYREEWAQDIISYLMGCALGRWNVCSGRDPLLAPPLPRLLEPLPLCPPGMLVAENGLPATATPSGYPLKLPPNALLVDEPGHTWDIEARVLEAATLLCDEPDAMITELLELFRRDSVREVFRGRFFKDHLSRYSRSRRKAPIYWPLTVPSKNWGLWLYAPMLTRERIYAVASEARRRERLSGDAISRLQREHREGGAGRPPRKVAEELDEEEKLAKELRQFRTEAERIAGMGWEPNLDDGFILCAAPLADLFPAWPDAKETRTALRKGKYEWATVAKWAEQL